MFINCKECGQRTENFITEICDCCWRIIDADMAAWLDKMDAIDNRQELPEDYRLDPLYKLLD